MEITVLGNYAYHHSEVLIFIAFAHCLDLFNTFNIVALILRNVSILEFHQDFHFTIITISIFFSNESRIIASIYSKLSGRCWLINSLLIVLRNTVAHYSEVYLVRGTGANFLTSSCTAWHLISNLSVWISVIEYNTALSISGYLPFLGLIEKLVVLQHNLEFFQKMKIKKSICTNQFISLCIIFLPFLHTQ